MSNSHSAQNRNQQFGRRKDVHRIIFAKGDRVTSVTIHPLFALAGAALALTFAVGYLGATGYLMFRDDLLNASRIRQVSIQNAYEDQLATLRIEIDRIASRQMLDQKSVENKLDRLLGLRASLEERQRAVNSLTQSATAAGISVPDKAPSPKPHPDRSAGAGNRADSADSGNSPAPALANAYAAATAFRTYPFDLADRGNIADQIRTTDHDIVDLNAIEENLRNEERAQADRLRLMAKKTVDSSRDIAAVIRSLGFKAPAEPPHTADAIGGPFEAANEVDPIAFDSSILALEENLEHLSKLKQTVELFPLDRPLKTGRITSQFGPRVDPFLHRYAIHSGMDFKAPHGTPVYATGPGRQGRMDERLWPSRRDRA